VMQPLVGLTGQRAPRTCAGVGEAKFALTAGGTPGAEWQFKHLDVESAALETSLRCGSWQVMQSSAPPLSV
jgi:hypothetical protein